ncbi:FUSC family protein [Gordonia sp. FQ]|uniref:FUSC family protein n=1 Tax=Gordonia sp. FQ TaxID=3446634 RepID=UPI003F84D0E9
MIPSDSRTPPARSAALTYPLRSPGWRSALTLDPSKASYWAPVRVGAAVGLVLMVGGLLGAKDVAGIAALGALVSAFCRPDPYRMRAGRLAALSVAVTASVAIGGLVGLAGDSLLIETAVIALLAGCAALLVGALRAAGPGAVVFVFAATAGAGFVSCAGDLARATTATALGSVIGMAAALSPWLYARARHRLGRGPAAAEETGYEPVRRALFRIPPRHLAATAARMTAAAAASALIAGAAGFAHPMWAAMGAVAALQGVDFHLTVSRGIARLLGNVVGAGIAAGLLMLPLGYWGAVLAIVVFQTIAEITAPVNYTLCSIAVTPMALLLTALGAGLDPTVALDRIADTLIGIVVGIVVAALTVSATDHLPAHRPIGATRRFSRGRVS